jgi:hypothetical protein
MPTPMQHLGQLLIHLQLLRFGLMSPLHLIDCWW